MKSLKVKAVYPMAYESRRKPCGEEGHRPASSDSDFGDQFGPDPMNLGQLQRSAETGVARRGSGERHLSDRQRPEEPVQSRERLLAHARAYAARVNQPSIRLVITEQERAEDLRSTTA